MYKFINPGNSKGVATIGARSSLLAVNRLGSTVSGLGNTVNNLEKIYKLSAKNEKLVEIAERRAKKRKLLLFIMGAAASSSSQQQQHVIYNND